MLPLAGLAASVIPDKSVVLTFDDAVKSHRSFVGPYLKELGFRATFFVTHRWMDDPSNSMTWQDIGELHRMGFEIGNHTWTHGDSSSPRAAARLAGELALVENELAKVQVSQPKVFAWPGNQFGPESLAVLRERGYQVARRGGSPEVEYGKIVVGPLLDVERHHPLLVPTTHDSYPDGTVENFVNAVQGARGGKISVLQFHGVPDVAHPWVHTPVEQFRRYMEYMKAEGYRTLALGDLAPLYDLANPPEDPMLHTRYRMPKDGQLRLPVEVEATQRELSYWTSNMRRHAYAKAEMERVAGGQVPDVSASQARLLPYPGGRHTRTGFREGAIDPMRGTKASIFPPWESGGYVVVDLPEAIFSDMGLLFLAHTHIPTLWNQQNTLIENSDWKRSADGSLSSDWTLPNQVRFGAHVRLVDRGVEMDIWLHNALAQPLKGLRTQVCVLLGGAPGFEAQTNDNKTYTSPQAAVQSHDGKRWIATEWERCSRVWGNSQCPCLHSDPLLPDCPPGETVRVRGKLWFHQGAAL